MSIQSTSSSRFESDSTQKAIQGQSRNSRVQEVADGVRNLFTMGFESEVPGVNQTYIGVRQVAPKRFCPRGEKIGVIPAPDREKRRLMRAKVLLEFGVEG